MIPFLHLGPLTIPTFGLSVACAMLLAYFVLRADLARRGIADAKSGEAETLVAAPCLAGFVGAKLYHLLETPKEFFADPLGLLFSPYGFAWFGGLLAGFATFAFVASRLVKRAAAEGNPFRFSASSMPARPPPPSATASAASVVFFPATATTASPHPCPGAWLSPTA
jgi:prolipoprotein diacylglyceryltransferase